MTIKVMLADDNREFVDMLVDYVTRQPDMEVVAVAYHGEQAMQILQDLPTPPDMLLLDIIMPHLDGLGVLERLQPLEGFEHLRIIMITAFGQDHILNRALEFGVSYYMLKPLDVYVLGERIRQLVVGSPQSARAKRKNITGQPQAEEKAIGGEHPFTLDGQISNMLGELSIPMHINGYRFLREAIRRVYENPMEGIGNITKGLYPSIAEKFDSTGPRVERAIRHAIEIAWTRGDREAFNRAMGYREGAVPTRPTNSECIAVLADQLRLTNQ